MHYSALSQFNLATWYLEKDNWDEVRDDVISRNLLQVKNVKQPQTYFQGNMLTAETSWHRDELELLVEGDHPGAGISSLARNLSALSVSL